MELLLMVLWRWICFITLGAWVMLDNFTILADTPAVHISERGEEMDRNVTGISCVEIREYYRYAEQLCVYGKQQ
jgi:hypothetical protein